MAILFTEDFASGLTPGLWSVAGHGLNATSPYARMYITSSGHTTMKDTQAARGESEVLVDITRYTAESQFAVGLNVTGDPAPVTGNVSYSGAPAIDGNGIYVSWRYTGTAHLYVNGTLVSSNVGPGISSASPRRARIRYEAGTLYVKVWIASNAEPGTWDSTTDLSGYTIADGVMAMQAYRFTGSNADVRWDNVSVESLAAPGVDAGFTTPPATASALMPEATVSTTSGVSAAAQPMTASAEFANAMGITHKQVLPVTSDTYVMATEPSTVHGNETGVLTGFGTYGSIYAYVKTDNVRALASEEEVSSAKLRVYLTTTEFGGGTISVHRLTSGFSESLNNWSSRPTSVEVATIPYVNSGVNKWVEFDVSAVVADWNAGETNHGIGLYLVPTDGSGSIAFQSSEGTNKPELVVNFAKQADVNMAAEPMEASAEFAEAAAGVGFTAAVMGGNAEFLPVTFSTDVNYIAQPMIVDALMGEAAGGTVSVSEPMYGSAEMVDAAVVAEVNVTAVAETLEAEAFLADNIKINGDLLGDSGDLYFQRITEQDPQVWLRLNESGGNDLFNAGDAFPDQPVHGRAFNVALGQEKAPLGRHSAYFNGDAYISQVEYGPRYFSGTDEAPEDYGNALEFSIRTTKRDAFLMHSYEIGASGTAGREWQIELKNGRLHFTFVQADPQGGAVSGQTHYYNYHTGTTDIADGQWHTIHIYREVGVKAAEAYSAQTANGVYVDGNLEFNRFIAGRSNTIWNGAFPDSIGGKVAADSGQVLAVPPRSTWFVGDLTEIVTYNPVGPFADNGQAMFLDYMAFNGWVPIEVEAATATATSGDHRGKGNKKRALYLRGFEPFSQWWETRPSASDALFGYDPEYDFRNKEIDEQIYDLEQYTVGWDYQDSDWPRAFGPVQTFPKALFGDIGSGYRDEITDRPRLIDLFKDVDLRDYDVILVDGWPNDSDEYKQVENMFGAGALEKFSNQLLDAAAQGKHLMVTHPQMALSLGIAEDIEWAPSLQEWRYQITTDPIGPGNVVDHVTAVGYDYASAVEFPWNVSDSPYGVQDGPLRVAQIERDLGSYIDYKANFYGDTHANTKFRVVALVDGLTDVPSHIVTNAVSLRGDWQRRGLKYADRSNGLRIGDEFFFHGASKGTELTTSGISSTDLGLPRGLPYWPAPKSGEAQGEFNLGYYNDPGDFRFFGAWAIPLDKVAAGTVVTTFGSSIWNGKQQVDNPYRNYATTVVLRPGDVIKGRTLTGKIFVNFTESPVPDALFMPKHTGPGLLSETEAQREWDWSFARANPTFNSVGYEWVRHYGMVARGMQWLAADEPVEEEGSVTIKATPLTAIGEVKMPEPQVEKNIEVVAGPALAIAGLVNAQGYESDEVSVTVLPMTATARITGYNKTFYATPMTATATLVVNSSIIATDTEQIVLYLHDVPVTLFLKEET